MVAIQKLQIPDLQSKVESCLVGEQMVDGKIKTDSTKEIALQLVHILREEMSKDREEMTGQVRALGEKIDTFSAEVSLIKADMSKLRSSIEKTEAVEVVKTQSLESSLQAKVRALEASSQAEVKALRSEYETEIKGLREQIAGFEKASSQNGDRMFRIVTMMITLISMILSGIFGWK